MSIQEYAERMKPVGVLYVDVYPYRVLPDRSVEFLMLKRRSDVVMPSRWQAVSGKLRAKETIHSAFVRQVEKKTGHRVEVAPLSQVNVFYDAHYDTVMMVPAAGAELGEDPISIDESLHVAHKWSRIEEAKGHLPWPTPQASLEEIALRVAGGG